MGPEKKGRFNWIWPDVSTIDGSKWAIRQAFWAAILCVGATVLFAVVGMMGVKVFENLELDAWNLLDAGAFGAIAFGLSRYSRVAAVAGLVLYILERIMMWADVGFKSPIIAIIFTLAFVGGVRGTWAYRKQARLSAAPPNLPVMPA